MIRTVDSFIHYFGSIRRRTLMYVRTIPTDRSNWSPKPGEFTCGEIVRHLAAAEIMFIGAVVEGKWQYRHPDDAEARLDTAIACLEESHTLAMSSLRHLSDAELDHMRPTLNGPPVRAWRLLMAMIEHEVHHRSQLAVYLTLMGVEPPQIYGLGIEDVIALATR